MQLLARLHRGIDTRPGLSRAVMNSGWLMADRVLRMIVGLVVWAWVARYLGPEELGVLSYTVALVAIFAVLATLGLNRIVIREIVSQPDQTDEILGTVFVLRLLASCLVAAAAYLASLFFDSVDPRTPQLVAIISAGIVLQAFDSIDLSFQAQVKSKYTVIAKYAGFLIVSAIKIALIVGGAPLQAFAWVILLEAALGAIGLAVVYQRLGNRIRAWCFELWRAKGFLRESWPEIFSGFGTLILMRIDQIMLGQMIGAEAVGLYSAAARVSEMSYFIPTAIVASTFPAVIKAKQVSERLYYESLRHLFVSLALVSVVIALLMTFTADFIIAALFGSNYRPAATVLVIHSWTCLAVSFGLVSGSWIVTEKKLILNLYRTTLGATANVILNLFLIPRFGIVGAAVGTLISLLTAFYLFDMLIHSMRPLFSIKTRAALFIDVRRTFREFLL